VWQGTPYRWQVYLNIAYPAASGVNLSAVFPGVDLTQTMDANTYWSAMSAYLSQTFGLSGVESWYAHGLGQDPTDPASADGSAAVLPPCSSITTSSVGPFNCDPTNGPVNYTVSQQQLANALQNPPQPSTNYTPWVLAAAAVAGFMLVAAGGRR
jgi:hypothetical protein